MDSLVEINTFTAIPPTYASVLLMGWNLHTKIRFLTPYTQNRKRREQVKSTEEYMYFLVGCNTT